MIAKEILKNIGNGDIPNTEVIREQPVITLSHTDYNGSEVRNVYLDELKNSTVGDTFYAERYSSCGRDVTFDVLTVLVKNNNGVLCHLSTERTSDDPDPVSWSEEKLIWFSYTRD